MHQPRLVADARHDDRLAALHDAAGDPLADAIAHGARDGAGAVGRLDAQVAAVLQERHDPAHGAVVPRQDLQHAMQRGLEVERPRQRLAHFEQRREAARFAAGGVAGRGDGRRADAQGHGSPPIIARMPPCCDRRFCRTCGLILRFCLNYAYFSLQPSIG